MRPRLKWIALAVVVLCGGVWLWMDDGGSGARHAGRVSVAFVGTRIDTNGQRVADFTVSNATPHFIWFSLEAVPHFVPPNRQTGTWKHDSPILSRDRPLFTTNYLQEGCRIICSVPVPTPPGTYRLELSFFGSASSTKRKSTRLQEILLKVGLRNLAWRLGRKYHYTYGEIIPLPPEAGF